MKKFLGILVLIFTLQTPSLADDITDFQIEGMSVGDSALDYFSEQEIKNGKRDYYKNKKFTDSELIQLPQFKEYHSVHINFKTSDKNYKIYALDGTILFKKNIKDCYKKKDEIVEEVSEIITDAKKRDTGTKKHSADKSGQSTTTSVWFDFKSGARIAVSCYDWSTKTGYLDHLRILIRNEEFSDFTNTHPYK